jgi:3-oxoacyl-[acyl-carrier protein] reductase/meso-butanediol dehydrogenase/(S,S)-butanediol dehydrogenase/diacetyl reductase
MKKGGTSRTLVITGGNRGIGEAITQAFWNEGYFVLAGARTETELVRQLGERVRFQKMDVRLESDHRVLAKTALEWTGHLDVFINCAGFSQWRAIREVDLDFWDKMIDTNLKGTFWGCKVAAENMPTGGCIINISSLAGKRGSANNSVYCVSKFGVNGLTQALAKELGPKGIRVNAVCPVYIKTKGLMEALTDERSPTQGQGAESYLEKFAAENAALKRLPSGEEVATMCLFLASPEASAITGQCINVDCGVLPQ